MKKFLAFLLVVVMATAMFAACDVKETIVVGYTVYKPMNYKDDQGNLVGFDTDLAKAVFEDKLGCKVVFKRDFSYFRLFHILQGKEYVFQLTLRKLV